jgi:PAS domain S-box-containing protein
VLGALSFVALTGYAYTVGELYDIPAYSTMALLTALCFSVLSGGILTARPNGGFVQEFASPRPGGVLSRKILAPVIILTVFVSAVIVSMEGLGYLGPRIGIGIMATYLVMLTSIKTWIHARGLNRACANLEKKQNENIDLRAALDEHAIVAITDPWGKITFVNDKFCAISQYSREELIGTDHRIINSGYHPKAFIQDLWNTIQAGQVWKGEICNRAKDGSLYWVDTTIVPFLDASGSPIQFVAIRADITDRMLAQKKIQQLNLDLEARVESRTAELSSTNKELEAFSYAVSHDLRAPLRAISGFSQTLDTQYRDRFDAKGKDYMDRVLKATTHMSNLIDDLLRLSQITQAPCGREVVNLSEVADKISTEMQQSYPDRSGHFQIEENLIVHGDATLLYVMMQNLLENAWKFSAKTEKPEVEFGAKQESSDPQVFFVRDNGAGFDMKYAHKLFGAFQRLHSVEEFPGTGIGLAIVQRVINRHNGKIWAEAEPQKGAIFYFTLPK